MTQRSKLGLVALGAAGLGLAAIVCSVGLSAAAVSAGQFPAAVALRPGDADIRSTWADLYLVQRRYADAERLARAALAQSPNDARALRVLGLAAEAQGNGDLAMRSMVLAARFGWRDEATQLWLFKQALIGKDFPAASIAGDALARTGHLLPQVFQLFWFMSTDDRGAAAVAARLADQPSWRPAFFQSASAEADTLDTDATFTRLLAAMRTQGVPATRTEVARYVTQLVDQGKYGRAHAAWTAGLKPAPSGDANLLRDGHFSELVRKLDSPRVRVAFEWSMSDISGVIVTAPAAGPGLDIQTDGGNAGRVLGQTVVLNPGTYRLAAPATPDTASIAGAFDWVITCRPSRATLASAPATQPNIEFAVPVTPGCKAQSIDLMAGQAFGGSDGLRATLRAATLTRP